MGDYAGWDFAEGQEISPGRVMSKGLGGGNRYEVLVWDDSLFALGVAKVLRPDQAEDEKEQRDLELRSRPWTRSPIRRSCAASTRTSMGTDDTSANGHSTRGTTTTTTPAPQAAKPAPATEPIRQAVSKGPPRRPFRLCMAR